MMPTSETNDLLDADSFYTVSIAWREQDAGGGFSEEATEFRVTADEMSRFSAALCDRTELVVVFPRRIRAGQEAKGFLAVAKRSLVACEAWPETEAERAARHNPPLQRYPRGIVGELRREVEQAAERTRQCQIA